MLKQIKTQETKWRGVFFNFSVVHEEVQQSVFFFKLPVSAGLENKTKKTIAFRKQ